MVFHGFSHMSDVRLSFILYNFILLPVAFHGLLATIGINTLLVQTFNNSVINKKVKEFTDSHHEKDVFRKKWM